MQNSITLQDIMIQFGLAVNGEHVIKLLHAVWLEAIWLKIGLWGFFKC